MNKIVRCEFEGNPYSFNEQGWFNATEAAKRFGKRPVDWLRLPETEKYLAALCKRSDVRKSHFTKTLKGNSKLFTQGTWLHPKLAIRFAQWLDIDFAIWCDEQIDNLIRANFAPPAIQDMMRLLLADSVSEWELRFPDSYYHALAHVTNTVYGGHIGGTPAVYGQITLEWVYAQIMPKDVLVEIKGRKTNSDKIHQWMTSGGIKLLDQQIAKIQAIAESSTDYQDFKSRCMQVCNRKGQLRIVYPN